MARSTGFRAREEQARVDLDYAAAICGRIEGMPAGEAIRTLRFTAGMTCPALARVVDDAAHAAAAEGLRPQDLIVVEARATPGPDIVRVRRHSHGHADWITTNTASLAVMVGRRLRPVPVAADHGTSTEGGTP